MKRRRTGTEKPLPALVADDYTRLSYGVCSRGIASDDDVLATWQEYRERLELERGEPHYDPRTFLAYWLAHDLDRELAQAAAIVAGRRLRDGQPLEDDANVVRAGATRARRRPTKEGENMTRRDTCDICGGHRSVRGRDELRFRPTIAAWIGKVCSECTRRVTVRAERRGSE